MQISRSRVYRCGLCVYGGSYEVVGKVVVEIDWMAFEIVAGVE